MLIFLQLTDHRLLIHSISLILKLFYPIIEYLNNIYYYFNFP